jgi:glycerophosphoryl diester phosphodiesterase
MTMPPLYAHRLGRGYGPDSSATALAWALAAGADGLETDVCLSADGELVLLHDPLLAVGTTLDGWAHETSAARIRRGYLRDRFGRPTDERPLTLDELLDAAPGGLPVQIEVKAHDPELARRTAQAVCERYRRRPRARDAPRRGARGRAGRRSSVKRSAEHPGRERRRRRRSLRCPCAARCGRAAAPRAPQVRD